MGSYLIITIDQVHIDLEKLQGDSEQREPLGCVLKVEYPLCIFYPTCKGTKAKLALHCLMPTKFSDALVYPRHQGSHIQLAHTPLMVTIT